MDENKQREEPIEKKKKDKKRKVWINLFLIFLLLIGLFIFLFFHFKSLTDSPTLDDILNCLKESQSRYESGFTPFESYFSSKIQYKDTASSSNYSLTYQKDPFYLNKVIEENGTKEEKSYVKQNGQYFLGGLLVSEEDVEKEIENKTCGLKSYFACTLDHFSYLIQSVSSFKETGYKIAQIEVGEELTYSLQIQANDENQGLNYFAFSFSKNALTKLIENSTSFYYEASFRFSN